MNAMACNTSKAPIIAARLSGWLVAAAAEERLGWRADRFICSSEEMIVNDDAKVEYTLVAQG